VSHPVAICVCPKCNLVYNCLITTETSIEKWTKWTTIANEYVKRTEPIRQNKEGQYITHCWYCHMIVKGMIRETQEGMDNWRKLNERP
jgi:hypothetical protein